MMILVILLICFKPVAAQNPIRTKVLALNDYGGFPYSQSFENVKSLLNSKGAAWNLAVTIDTSAAGFTLEYLRGFDVVLLSNTSSIGTVFPPSAKSAFIQWMEEGGAAVGLHGVMDHSDTWKWFTDNLALTKFAGWGDPGCSGGASVTKSMVHVDTLPTGGTVRARKEEYASLLAVLPAEPWSMCEKWMSFTFNPRDKADKVDVLITVDEKTYLPSSLMGDHPVTWTVRMPASSPGGRQGRYYYTNWGWGIYFPAGEHGFGEFEDQTSQDILHFGICWAAGREFTRGSCLTSPVSALHAETGSERIVLETEARVGELRVGVTGPGEHAVEVFTLSGKKVAEKTGTDAMRFVVGNLAGHGIYWVRVKTGNRTLSRRTVVP